MLIVLSPSKTIDTTNKATTKLSSQACFIKETAKIASSLKKLSTEELSKLMNISPKLAQLNYERIQLWNKFHSINNSKQAILSFKGEVYSGLNANSFSDDALSFAQEHLIILSGFYGLLRPLDLIQPYRLEISTKLEVSDKKNLYKLWTDLITSELNRIMSKSKDKTIINLASNEYFKAIDLKKLKANIITPVFKEYKHMDGVEKNGNYKIISIYAKKARGLMSNFIVNNQIENVDELKLFDHEGYYYNDVLSKQNEIVFTRG